MTYVRKLLYIESPNFINQAGAVRYGNSYIADVSNSNRLARQMALCLSGEARVLAFFNQFVITDTSMSAFVSLSSGVGLNITWLLAEGIIAKRTTGNLAFAEGEDVTLRLQDSSQNNTMATYLSTVLVFD